MEIEVGALTGAGHGEEERDAAGAAANGYRDSDWETRAGTVELPASRSCARATYFAWASSRPRRKWRRRRYTAVIQEAYIQGISTRSVDDLVKAMGMNAASPRARSLGLVRGDRPAG